MIWGPGVSDECVDWASSAPGVKAPEGRPVDEGGRAPGCGKRRKTGRLIALELTVKQDAKDE